MFILLNIINMFSLLSIYYVKKLIIVWGTNRLCIDSDLFLLDIRILLLIDFTIHKVYLYKNYNLFIIKN